MFMKPCPVNFATTLKPTLELVLIIKSHLLSKSICVQRIGVFEKPVERQTSQQIFIIRKTFFHGVWSINQV